MSSNQPASPPKHNLQRAEQQQQPQQRHFPPAAYQAQTAKEVIASTLKPLIEQLKAGHSGGLTAYLTAMGRFHNYSFGNILEIARQMPSAQRVAGFYAWKKFGRNVMKG